MDAGSDQGRFGEGEVGGVTAPQVLEETDFIGLQCEFAMASFEGRDLIEDGESINAEHGLVGRGGQLFVERRERRRFRDGRLRGGG